VLYFYPRDDTATCTRQACGFRDEFPRFSGLDAVVLGVSTDGVRSHQRFRAKYDLPFTLLADVEHRVAERYGVWGEKQLYGRTYMGILRTTFVIDARGRVARVFERVKADGHAAEVAEALAGLAATPRGGRGTRRAPRQGRSSRTGGEER
jgi:peroxiredoxin Q/BCP